MAAADHGAHRAVVALHHERRILGRLRPLGRTISALSRTGTSTRYLPSGSARTTAVISIAMARGKTRRPTATSGTRAWTPGGVRTTTAAGPSSATSAGRGSAARAGAGPRTTTAGGATAAIAGTGFLSAAGRQRGCRGPRRRAITAGARSATTTAPSSASASRSVWWTGGAAGPCCPRGTSAAATALGHSVASARVTAPGSIRGFAEYRGAPGRPSSVRVDATPLRAPTAPRRGVAVPRSGAIAPAGPVRADAVRDASAYQRGATRVPESRLPPRDPAPAAGRADLDRSTPSRVASPRSAPGTPSTPEDRQAGVERRAEAPASSRIAPSRQPVSREDTGRAPQYQPETARPGGSAPTRQAAPRSRGGEINEASGAPNYSTNAPADARPSRSWSAPSVERRAAEPAAGTSA